MAVKLSHIAYIVLILLLALGVASHVAYATTISQQEARKIFNKYCKVCHNGATATSFDQLLETLKSWVARYPDIDTAIKKEYGVENYDALMKEMKKITPTIPDEEFKKLYSFFKAYFEEAKKAGIITVTLTILETVTKTSTVYSHVTITLREGAPDDTVKLVSAASLIGATIVAIAVILLIHRVKTV